MDFKTLINDGLEGVGADDALLESTKLKADLQTITSNFDKANGPLKATIVCTLAKAVYPDWDTRKHKVELGGKFSLRSIDHSIVCPYLYEKGFYPTATEAFLNVTFRANEVFSLSYSANISPKPCKPAFLNILHTINEHYSLALCKAILAFCLQSLRQRKERADALKASTITIKDSVTLKTVEALLGRIFTAAPSGISVVPSIAMHTACTLVQWPSITIKPLKEHTAADGNSKAYGDVEGFGGDGATLLAIEVKHGIAITPTLLATFEEKTAGIPLRYMVTTKEQKTEITDSNVRISTVTDAILGLLHASLFHNPKIAIDYTAALRARILEYHNLSLSAKEAIAAVFLG